MNPHKSRIPDRSRRSVLSESGNRRRELPYLFAYDIGPPRRARQVRRCLQRWRMDGQLSVHETALLPFQVRELAAELLDYVDRQTDRLLLCQLSQRGGAPVYALSLSRSRPSVLGGKAPTPLPSRLQKGWYLLAYDVRDERRLQRIQSRTAKVCTYLQRSVYLYHGEGPGLARLLEEIAGELERQVDDMRLYALSGPRDLWFLSGPMPPLVGLNAREPMANLWQRLLRWIGVH
jgi:CRISPR-associated protein Cas2